MLLVVSQYLSLALSEKWHWILRYKIHLRLHSSRSTKTQQAHTHNFVRARTHTHTQFTNVFTSFHHQHHLWNVQFIWIMREKNTILQTTNENSFGQCTFPSSPSSSVEYSMLFHSTLFLFPFFLYIFFFCFCLCCCWCCCRDFCCYIYCPFSLSFFIKITILIYQRWFVFTVDGKKERNWYQTEKNVCVCVCVYLLYIFMLFMYFNSLAIFQGNSQRCLDLLPI